MPSTIQTLLEFAPVLALALGATLLATPICRRIALARNVVDRPDDWLKPHKRPIPYLGGVAIFVGWTLAIVCGVLLFPRISGQPAPDWGVMLGITFAGAFIMGTGLFDDLRLASPRFRLIATALVGIFLMVCGVGECSIAALAAFLGDGNLARWPGWSLTMLSAAPALFVLMGACNAVNLIDGMDGLCAGTMAVAMGGLAALELVIAGTGTPSPERLILCLATLGASAGFLMFNRHPASIFMGDAGSMLLGLSAAVVILLHADTGRIAAFLGAVVVFGLPVMDMSLTLFRRWRNHRPLMQGDRSHYYDQLVDRGLAVPAVVRLSYAMALIYAVAGCVIAVLEPVYALLAFVGVIVVVAAGVARARLVRVDQPPASASGT